MFDFSFSEIALIGVVALVVIGPERLPKVARTAGVVVGRVRRYAASVRADIAREVELSELRQAHNDLQEAAKSFESGVKNTVISAESTLVGVHEDVMIPVTRPLDHHETESGLPHSSIQSEILHDSHSIKAPEKLG